MTECPMCGRDDFKNELGMKQHHSQMHDKSIAGKIVECSNCGKEFRKERKQRAENQDHHFCSRNCYGEWLSEITGEDHPCYNTKEVECDVCGSVVERTASTLDKHNHTFCSMDCLSTFQSRNRKGEWSHLWSGGKEDAVCENCSQDIKVSKWRLKQSEYVFCDRDCHAEYRSDGERPYQVNYGKNWEETREKRMKLDNDMCVVCGITRENHYKEYGVDLSVHHRNRFTDFDDVEEANRMSNLITLCSHCHRKVESEKIELDSDYKPSLDDWPSSTAADDDAVVLAEQLGLPYDEKEVDDSTASESSISTGPSSTQPDEADDSRSETTEVVDDNE